VGSSYPEQSNHTVAEDDAISIYISSTATDILSELPADWDIVLWGFNFDLFACFEMIPGVSMCLAQFQQERMRTTTGTFQKQRIVARAYPLVWAFGTACYSISPKGAREFKSRLLPLRPIIISIPEAARASPYSQTFRSVGIDNSMNAVYRDVKAFVCFPPLVVSKNESAKSTVQELGPGFLYAGNERTMNRTWLNFQCTIPSNIRLLTSRNFPSWCFTRKPQERA
jgi:hypothetical protein